MYNLNEAQVKAVEHVEGRLLLLAGAGSGKTRVLTLRMAHLIQQLKVSPHAILGLTFTNKAAAEMRHRLASLVHPTLAKQLTLSTFHQFCMQVLRHEIHHLGYTSSFTLYDEHDVMRLVNVIARDLLECEGDMPSITPTFEAIIHARNKGLKPDEMKRLGSSWHHTFTKSLYTRLQDSMRAYNAVDFDSLLTLTVQVLESNQEILSKYQKRFQFVMIDEYQDTNPIQYKLAALLTAKHQNLCVVGDDDQSIYGWRGADVQNILAFSDAKVIKLEQNYRSTNTILKAANAVIANNLKRHGKALWSLNGDGELIDVFFAPTEVEEAESVVSRMHAMRLQFGLNWKDMAILYRSNALSRNFEEALLKFAWKDGDKWIRGIPYHIHGGVEFYERKEVSDLMAYLRIIVNSLDQMALLRSINYPRRGIGEAALDLMTAYNRSQGISLWEVLIGVSRQQANFVKLREKMSDKALRGVDIFVDLIEMAKKKFQEGLHLGALWLVEVLQYKKAIHEEVKSEQMRAFKWENVQEFISSIATYEGQNEVQADKSLQEYVQSLPINAYRQEDKENSHTLDKVNLMTFHSAKGLEFPACFLVGVEDHIIPHEKSVLATGIEEERRLMYVAMTRAMKFLTISMAKKRKKMGTEVSCRPSRFLMEVPKELMRLSHWHEV